MSELYPESESEDECPLYADGTRWLLAHEISLKNAQKAGFIAICPEYLDHRKNEFIKFLKSVKESKYLLVFNYKRRPSDLELIYIHKYYGKLN